MVYQLSRHAPNARVIIVTDDPTGIVGAEVFPLWSDCGQLKNATKDHLPSCYRRLKLYDRQTQREMGIPLGDRIVSLDLDTLVCGPLDDVLNTSGLFVGWGLIGEYHERVYNGSFQMFHAGTLQDIWGEFDPDYSPRAARQAGYLGSDQSWLSWRLASKEGVRSIDYPTFASYPMHCLRMGSFMKSHRLVFFHGRVKPWDKEASDRTPWVKRYWRDADVLSE
jgi:hypothetical protein